MPFLTRMLTGTEGSLCTPAENAWSCFWRQLWKEGYPCPAARKEGCRGGKGLAAVKITIKLLSGEGRSSSSGSIGHFYEDTWRTVCYGEQTRSRRLLQKLLPLPGRADPHATCHMLPCASTWTATSAVTTKPFGSLFCYFLRVTIVHCCCGQGSGSAQLANGLLLLT